MISSESSQQLRPANPPGSASEARAEKDIITNIQMWVLQDKILYNQLITCSRTEKSGGTNISTIARRTTGIPITIMRSTPTTVRSGLDIQRTTILSLKLRLKMMQYLLPQAWRRRRRMGGWRRRHMNHRRTRRIWT